MVSPPDAHDNAVHGAVSGQLVQARNIHGGVTINVPPAPPAPLSDVSLDPPRLATAVRGRDELLAELGAAMEVGAPVPHVLTGPGGFGKTTVAAALAEQARADGWTVFWVRPGSVAASMLEAAVEVGGSRAEADRVRPTRRQAARWVWRHLDNAPRPWLLVIDNADRPEELDPENRPGDQLGWMRASPGGFVLVTSRVDDPAQWAPARVHRIGQLDGDAATGALSDHAGLVGLPGARALAERLGGVPLALFLAGRILATHQVLFPDARALLHGLDQGVSKLDELAAPLVSGGDTERTLLSGVWELSLRLVSENEPKAAVLLRLLSVLGPFASEIPLRRLPITELGAGVLGRLSEAELARLVNALVVHGLISVVSPQGETALRLHPLVSETVRARFGESDLPLVEEAERLLALQRDHDLGFELRAQSTVTDLYLRLRFRADPAVIDSIVSGARSLMLLNFTDEALSVLEPAVEEAVGALGASHPATLRAQHAVGDVFRAQEQIEEAEAVYRAVHRVREESLGPTHPETLTTRHQLALMAGLRGDLDTAEEGFRAVWEALAEAAPEDHTTSLQALENLAYVRMLRGDLEAAEEGFRHVLRVRREVLGSRHPVTVSSEFYVARNAFERGDHTRAEKGFGRAFRERVRILGEDHPTTQAAREWWEKAQRRLREG
ncbi:tetratricopeptide repeat protein [Nocardiopsis aegyptia]|uniref:Tetratricopeptide (TPR) repeat protein/Mrp family chromosome partitioning ATPase n=1 Tax=Nocardiopsis aegyptia TaxID=220378 RepID=A0A7Z0ESI3_9ACTN|nr:tetratricopeptide repeat protein [Nocardiopsis aegyptia]NYJ36478.1 tetratricopeptide (TPR) repeat protein/Mrp family chromosome partitioning ATPase [Nocardiopsis aegyptia]